MRPRRVAILLYPGVQSLDVTGPLEVFATADALLGHAGRQERGYEVRLLAASEQPLRSSSGMAIVPDRTLEGWSAIDTLIVPGGSGRGQLQGDADLHEWLAREARRARRVASVCTGAFLLAEAGLLDGRRVTTHWAHAAKLARRHPELLVDPDPIFIRDGPVWTSAGVTAGMDLALALVEEDHDRELALQIARQLVMFLRRPGNQSQFSATMLAQEPQREPLRELQRLLVEEIAGEHTVEAMAARVHMSPRHFARAFRAETGMTPARYVERVRLEAARRRLEEDSEPIGAIAQGCGFGTAETMRRAFLRLLGVGPAEYRRRFQGQPGSARRQDRRPSAA
ncbi:MAG: GlxA family transcriptional regulator [Solirubrobacteraceae bacterium]